VTVFKTQLDILVTTFKAELNLYLAKVVYYKISRELASAFSLIQVLNSLMSS